MNLREKYHRTKQILLPSIIVFVIYGGLLLIEGLFLEGGDLYVSLITLYAGIVCIAACLLFCLVLPFERKEAVIVCTLSQLTFLGVGTYLRELEFYFFFLIMLFCVISVTKSFIAMLWFLGITLFINCLAFMFLLPRIEWLNSYRFFMQFAIAIFGAVFMLIQTYHINNKENRSGRALASFSSLLQSTPNFMIITDENSRIRYISEPMVKFAGLTSAEIAVGKPLLDLFPDRKLKEMFAGIFRAEGNNETVVSIDINNETRHFKVIADKLTGDAEGLFIDISDITVMANLQKNTENALKAAEEANKTKSQFLATMSHEIRTPMNAILGITQMELQDPNLPSKNASALDKIYNSGNTLLGIINDILDMSKIESGKLELNPIEYDVPSLIHDATQINVVRIGSKNIQFFIDADKNLPSRLIGDELRIKQILNNLLSNAFKYTEEGTVRMTVRTDANPASPTGSIRLQFIVEDSGQGLKPEDLKKLFSEEYLRFNLDSNQKTEGTGLGLNITKNLIDLMEGDISAQSEYGKGSIFTVNIVQQIVPNAPPIGIEVSEKLKNFAFTGKKGGQQIIYEIMPYGKVLVVDDVDTNLYVAQGLMSPYELTIDTAISGFKALEVLENNHYDIVFMDHMMPLMDGIETTKKLRENGYKGTIIALTANAIVGSAEMFKQNGFDDFLSKPIDIRQLNAFLNKWIRDKHPEEAIKYRNQQKIDVQTSALKADNKLLEVFCKDAEKASITLREALENDDLPLFTTTVHAMKSALANIGELDKSAMASKLEDAGRDNDIEYIHTHINELLKSLEELIIKYATNDLIDDSDVVEDTVYLKEQLLIIKTACLDYDDNTALSIIERLKEKPWQNTTIKVLDEIHDLLYFSSDFDEAACKVSELL